MNERRTNATNLKVEKNPKQQQDLMCMHVFCVCAYISKDMSLRGKDIFSYIYVFD